MNWAASRTMPISAGPATVPGVQPAPLTGYKTLGATYRVMRYRRGNRSCHVTWAIVGVPVQSFQFISKCG
jgi:hypothetical protein